MASYIGKVQIGVNDPVLIGSTLYGLCYTTAETALKDITATTRGNNNPITGDYVNTSYDNLIRGTTIHIKFIYGNSATTNTQLKVGTLTTAQNVVGNFTCPANTIISFTLDENQNWVVNDNVDTNTEYVFKTAYNASTNKAVTETDLTNLNIQDAAHKGVISDIGANTSSTDLPTTAAVASYVQAQTGGLSGLTGAMHFRGTSTVPIADGDDATVDPTINGYTFNGNGDNAGDVVLYDEKEFVWTGTTWELLGDEGSYALKSSTDTVTEVASTQTISVGSASGWNAGGQASLSITENTNTAASLTENSVQIPNVTSAGSATTASVAAGILNITIGAAPTIAETPITVKEIGNFTPNIPIGITFTTNTLPQLTVTPTDTSKITTNDVVVVVPNNNNNNP